MKIAWRDRWGGPEVIELREVETPVPTGDQVRVKVHAASVNRADLDWMLPKFGFVGRLFVDAHRSIFGYRKARRPGGVYISMGGNAVTAVTGSPRSRRRSARSMRAGTWARSSSPCEPQPARHMVSLEPECEGS